MHGTKIALVSNAGMPAIQDPGELLVKECLKHEINVIPLPGAFAGVTALVASGLGTTSFSFFGFLPKKRSDKDKTIKQFKNYPQTLIIYEAVHRLIETLTHLRDILGERRICIARELTKKHEQFIHTTLKEAINFYKKTKAKGEFTLIIEGAKEKTEESYDKALEMLKELKKSGLKTSIAVKLISKIFRINKNILYKLTLDNN